MTVWKIEKKFKQSSPIFFLARLFAFGYTHESSLYSVANLSKRFSIHLVFREIKASGNEKLRFFSMYQGPTAKLLANVLAFFNPICYARFALARWGSSFLISPLLF